MEYAYHPLQLPQGGTIDLALPAGSTDPVVQAYARGEPLNRYLVDWLLRFSAPGSHVLDLGCHVGTLSAPAAALGRNVLAVDASRVHVEGVRLTAQRNRLRSLNVIWCAVTRFDGEIQFDENGLWGMVSRTGGTSDPASCVPAQRADTLVRTQGWDHVDFVKMDVEGSELAAIESLGDFATGDRAPVVVYESNGMTFEMFGYGIPEVRQRLEDLGYQTFRVEGSELVYSPPDELQPEAWLDVIALPPSWRARERAIVAAWAPDALVRRCLEWGSNEHRNVREYLHGALARDFDYPRADDRIKRLRDRLAAEFGEVDRA